MSSSPWGSSRDEQTAAHPQGFYGLCLGDEVCVHGEGFGTIVEIHESTWSSSDFVTVSIKREERHAPSGQMVRWTKAYQVHPRNVTVSSTTRALRLWNERHMSAMQPPKAATPCECGNPRECPRPHRSERHAAGEQETGGFSHDDETRLLSTVMPDDGPTVRAIKNIVGERVKAPTEDNRG